MFEKIGLYIAEAIWALNRASELAVFIAHWAGRFFVLLIFTFAALAVANHISITFGMPLFEQNHWVVKITELFSNQGVWVPATAIVGTTVALGHFQNLDINMEKAAKERLEQNKKA